MPWKCPACLEQIHHQPIEDRPRPGAIYRCHVCRMELTPDRVTGKLVPMPLDTAADTGTPDADRRR